MELDIERLMAEAKEAMDNHPDARAQYDRVRRNMGFGPKTMERSMQESAIESLVQLGKSHGRDAIGRAARAAERRLLEENYITTLGTKPHPIATVWWTGQAVWDRHEYQWPDELLRRQSDASDLPGGVECRVYWRGERLADDDSFVGLAVMIIDPDSGKLERAPRWLDEQGRAFIRRELDHLDDISDAAEIERRVAELELAIEGAVRKAAAAWPDLR